MRQTLSKRDTEFSKTAFNAADEVSLVDLIMATSSAIPPPGRAGKYVTFQLSKQYFAVEARRIRQVLPSKQLMSIDGVAGPIHGLVHTNGRRFPVIDVRERLGVRRHSERGPQSVILLQPRDGDATVCVGIIADKMSDVVEFRERDIRGNVAQLRMYGRPYGRPKTLIDPESLFTKEELARFRDL